MRDTREPADIARQLSLKTWVEPALRRAATIEINSRMPLDEVVERIVRLVSCAVATQQPWVCTQPMRTSAPRRRVAHASASETQWFPCAMVRAPGFRRRRRAHWPRRWCKESNGLDGLIPATRAMAQKPRRRRVRRSAMVPSCLARGRPVPGRLLESQLSGEGGCCLLAVHLVEPFAVAHNHASSHASCGAISRTAGDMT